MVPLPAGCILRLQHGYETSRGPQSHVMSIEADGHSVTSFAGNTIITSHIHFKAGTNTSRSLDFIELDVCGADAVVIQAEGEAAAGVRLRLRAVPPTPTCHVS